MTRITFEKTDRGLTFIGFTDTGEITGEDSVWFAAPDIVLSENASPSIKQESLASIIMKANSWEPEWVDDYNGDDTLKVYHIPRTRMQTKYLKIRDKVRDTYWYSVKCVPYEDGAITIGSLHPDSPLRQQIEAGNQVIREDYQVILKNETVSNCTSCGELSRLHPCVDYDESGDTLPAVMLCENCLEDQGFIEEVNGTYYPFDIEEMSHPGYNYLLSYKFGGILNYSFKTTSCDQMSCFQSGKLDTPRDHYLGVELEVSGKAGMFTSRMQYGKEVYKRVEKGFIALCDDASLDSDGRSFEIKTVPAKLNYLKERLAPLYRDDLLTSAMPSKDTRYGMHVHINRKSLTALQLSKMVSFLNASENRVFVEMVAGRNETSYTEYDNRNRYIRKRESRGSNRRSAVNLSNNHTVEIRIFNTPHSYEQLCYRLEFCDALALFCRNHAGFKDLSFTSFIKWVNNSNRGYVHLKRFCSGLKFKDITIPIDTIIKTRDVTNYNIYRLAEKLEGLPSFGTEQYVDTLKELLLACKKKEFYDVDLTTAVIDFVYGDGGNSYGQLYSILTEDVCDCMPSSCYFQYVNGRVSRFNPIYCTLRELLRTIIET